MTVVQHSGSLRRVEPLWLKQAAFTCDECGRLSIGEKLDADGPSNVTAWLSENVETWRPARTSEQEFDDVPEHIGSAATEATRCFSIGAYRAVGSLTRAVVEATAKDKGITTGQLWAKIDALHAGEFIREHVKEAAHEVRHFGNDMAHGDFVDEVTLEEAEEAIALMAELLNEVYQSPARVERVRAARLAKQASS